MPDRAAAPVIGVVLVVALTAVTAAGVGALAAVEPPEETPSAAFSAAAAPDGTVTVTHRGGDAIQPAELRVRISVDGRRLAAQPPVPFFAAEGFVSGPTGPFNRGHAGRWTAGETASLRVASTNRPTVRAGATVTVELYVSGRRVATLRAIV